MAELIGKTCVVCQVRINWVGDSQFCAECRQPIHNACARPTPEADETTCPTCGTKVPAWEDGSPRRRSGAVNAGAESDPTETVTSDNRAVQGPIEWWVAGMLGGLALTFLTVVRLIRGFAGAAAGDDDLGEIVGFAAALFGMGFLCGVIVWGGSSLHRKFGMAGDALVGAVVLVVFFICCMILFAPESFDTKRESGVTMLCLGAIVGSIGGVIIGRGIRKDLSQLNRRS